MCMIFFKPKDKPFPEYSVFNHILMSNPHGTGVLCNGEVKKWDRECFPDDFIHYSSADAVMLHSRIATRGSIRLKNIHPFSDERLPGYWFAHNGTTAYHPDDDMTDSEFFYKTVLVPFILLSGKGPAGLIGKYNGMRTAGSRFILWSGKNEDTPYFYGEWYIRKGVYYSHYISGGKPVGVLDRWWQPASIS